MAGDLCDEVGVLSFHDEFVFVLQELGELSEQVRGQRCEAHLLSAVDGKAFQGPDDNVVVMDPGDGNLLDGNEMLERIEELLLRITFFFNVGLLFLSWCTVRGFAPVWTSKSGIIVIFVGKF